MVVDIQSVEDLRKAIKSAIDETSNLSAEALQNSVAAFLDQTGLINESVDILKDELQCPVCHAIPVQACLTDCHHIFCSYCLGMWQFTSKSQCPMCRAALPYYNHKQLRNIDMIINLIMSRQNSQYMSWLAQEVADRFNKTFEEHLRAIHRKIVLRLENLNPLNGDEKYRQTLESLAQKYLSLMKALPCSRDNLLSFLERNKELDASVSASGINII